MNSPKLNFFHFDSCPFCLMVKGALESMNIKYTDTNIHQDNKALEKLIADTGRKTVPVLYIDDKPMAESRDIIKWLESNQANLEKN